MPHKFLFSRDGFNLYPWYFSDQCLTKELKELFGKKLSKIISEIANRKLVYYPDIEEFNDIGEYLFKKVKEDKTFYKNVEKNILLTGDELLNLCNSIPSDIVSLSNQELLDFYNNYRDKTRKMRAWGWVPVIIDGVSIHFLSDSLQEGLRSFLKSINQEERTAKYYSLLTSADKMSEIQTEEIERLQLIKKLQELNLIDNLESKKALGLIKQHAKKFEWLTYAYIGPKMNEQDVINLIKDSLKNKEPIDKQVKEIHNHYKNVRKQKNELIDKINLSEELVYLSEVSSFFMRLKDMRKGIYQKSYVLMDSVIQEIAKRLNLNVEQTKYLIDDEIKQALLDNKDFSEVTNKRIEYCVTVTENGKTKVYTGNRAKEIIKNETAEDKIDTDISELKGSTAYSGKVKGIAKIVLVKQDISKIQKGEILISSATNPDLIIAMKKAAAFVTDTGGITTHAAIVSREMKKPCIVGTKIATKVIQDGDFVEVDAEKGIVKILKRK